MQHVEEPTNEPSRQAFTILVVDDEPVLAEELSEYLLSGGYQVQTATDGDRALNIYRNHPPGTFDVILTDLRMPGLSGFSLAQCVLQDTPEAAAVEIVVITGHGTPSSEGETPVGIFSVIRKPLRLAKLELVVRQACKASMVRRLAVAGESGSSGLHKA